MKSSLSPLCRRPEDGAAAKDQQLKDQRRGGFSQDFTEKSNNITTMKGVAAEEKKKQVERKPSVDINESAEAFINKFRHQLLIQRLESIENYEQMLARGT